MYHQVRHLHEGHADMFKSECMCGFMTMWGSINQVTESMTGHLLMQAKIEEAVALVRAELERAMKKHPKPFYSAHDGYAKLLEEVDEAWDEIKRDDPIMTRKEMTHVGAMALRYLIDVSGK